jgi:hypothetical protein
MNKNNDMDDETKEYLKKIKDRLIPDPPST